MNGGVLVIEDEDTLRQSIVRGLSRQLPVNVRGAATLREALEAIDEQPPSVILCDLDLPDRAGIEILGELGRRGLRASVTFVSAYTRAFLAQIPKHAGVRVLEKPVSVEQLRKLVREDLEKLGESDPTPFGVADFLQLAAMGGHSVLIEVPSRFGRVIVVRGQLWSAHDKSGDGDGAFRRLCLLHDGVRCTTLREPVGAQNVQGNWEAMLLDAAREQDERGRGGAVSDASALLFSTPPPKTEPDEAVASRLGARANGDADPQPDPRAEFSADVEAGLEALLLRKYDEAWRAFRRAAQRDPTDRTVQGNLARLREMGHADDEPVTLDRSKP